MTKKLHERAIIEAFLTSESLPHSSLEAWERERPDALIRVDGRVVGIEVTTLSEAVRRQPTAPQQWTAEAKRVVEAARMAFQSLNSSPFVVRFQFRPDWLPPDKRSAARLASELAAVVETAAQRLGPEATKPLTLKDPHVAVSWAYLGRSRPEWGGNWAPSFGFDGVRATPEDIASTVARKEPELAEYRRAASEVWLLIDCNLTGQGVAFHPPAANIEIVTGFSRVFCCGFGRWEWVEVYCVPQHRPAVPMTG